MAMLLDSLLFGFLRRDLSNDIAVDRLRERHFEVATVLLLAALCHLWTYIFDGIEMQALLISQGGVMID